MAYLILEGGHTIGRYTSRVVAIRVARGLCADGRLVRVVGDVSNYAYYTPTPAPSLTSNLTTSAPTPPQPIYTAAQQSIADEIAKLKMEDTNHPLVAAAIKGLRQRLKTTL